MRSRQSVSTTKLCSDYLTTTTTTTSTKFRMSSARHGCHTIFPPTAVNSHELDWTSTFLKEYVTRFLGVVVYCLEAANPVTHEARKTLGSE